MTIFHSLAPEVPDIPDDQDLYTFMTQCYPSYRFDARGTGLPLLIDEETGQKWTYEDALERIDRLAIGLQERLGVGQDTVVAIFSANCVDYLITILACHKVGAIVSCANPSFQPSELAYQLDACKATVLFVGQEAQKEGIQAAQKAGIAKDHVVIMQTPSTCQREGALKGGSRRIQGDAWALEGLVAEGKESEGISVARPKLGKGDAQKKLAFLSFSSGTTGLPKGVMIQHYAPIANVLQNCIFNEMKNPPQPGDRYQPGKDVSLGCLPFYHIYGLVVSLLFTFFSGITNVCIPKFRGIEAMIQTSLKYKITLWWLVPPQVVLLVKDPSAKKYYGELRKLIRFLMIGAAPLSDDLSSKIEEILPGLDWGQGWGMTECCTVGTMAPLHTRPVFGSAGRLFPNVSARVVNPEGKDVGVDEPGEFWIKAPTVTLGYLGNQKATEEMWTSDGWMKTGDEVRFNKDGDMFIVDRLKELIKVKGFQVAPAELEGWILNHDDVADVGVIGIPNEDSGEIPIAFVVLSAAAKESRKDVEEIKKSIKKFVSDNKIRYKHLGRVEIIDAIPKTPSGKILRKDLRLRAKNLAAEGGEKSKL